MTTTLQIIIAELERQNDASDSFKGLGCLDATEPEYTLIDGRVDLVALSAAIDAAHDDIRGTAAGEACTSGSNGMSEGTDAANAGHLADKIEVEGMLEFSDAEQALFVRALRRLDAEKAVVDHALRWARLKRLQKTDAEIADAELVLISATEALETERIADATTRAKPPPAPETSPSPPISV